MDKALSRLVRTKKIRRLGRGLYDLPRLHPKLGPLSPSPEAVARAFARSGNSRLQISGARAANLLGISSQVPAKLVYATDGRSRRLKVAGQTIDLRRAVPRRLAGADRSAGAVLQALRSLGRRGITDDVIAKLRNTLSETDKKELARLKRNAPAWAHPLIDRIVAQE